MFGNTSPFDSKSLHNKNNRISRISNTNMASNKIPTFKVILLGESGTGKTSYVKRLTGRFQDKYVPTVGSQITTVQQNTSKGQVRFKIWDTAGQNEHSDLLNEFYMYSDAAILFFDVTRESSLQNLTSWNTEILNICKRIPTVFCANKIDLLHTSMLSSPPKCLIEAHSSNISYAISTLKELNIKKLLLWIARKLLNDSALELIGDAVTVNPITEEEYKHQLKEFLLSAINTLIDK